MATPARSTRHLATSPFKPRPDDPVVDYAVGDRVSHDSYGLGVVTGLESGKAVRVDFGRASHRIALPSRKLFLL